MVRRVNYALLFVLVSLLALMQAGSAHSQEPQPVVSFDADKYHAGPSEPVTLTWNFENIEEAILVWPGGKQETLYGPGSKTIVFPTPGDYSLTLRALYEGGEKQIWIIFRVTGEQPQPVCTPPACPTGTVLRCPDGQQCPGGCGMACMSPNRIWWVRGNVRDSIVGAGLGDATITCEGGSVSASTRSLADGTFDLTWQAPVEAATGGRCGVQIAGFDPAEAALGTSGADGSYQLQFTLKPVVPHGNGEWAIDYVAAAKTVELGQPLGPVQPLTVCARKFQNGGMLWRSGDKRNAIVPVIEPTGRFFLLDDAWDQHTSPSCAPSNTPGLYLPDRGLGWAWCTNQSIRESLGYSTEPQEVCDDPEHARLRDYQNGRLVWVPSWNQVIYLRWSGGLWSQYDFSP